MTRTSSMSSSSVTAVTDSRFLPQVSSSIVAFSKESSDYTSCESIVSGKGRVSVLKKSSLGSLNSVISSNSCLRTSVSDSRSSSRKEKHGVSFAVPYTDPCVYTRQTSDPSSHHTERRYSVGRGNEKEHFRNINLGASQNADSVSCDQFSNIDEFGIIFGAGSNSSIVSGTYSYDPVLCTSTDSEISATRRCSPMRNIKSCEVDPWNVENILPTSETDCVLIRKDTPPPKPLIPTNSDKDLRKLIKKHHNRTISMSTQTLRKSRGDSSENLVSQNNSNTASFNSLDQIISAAISNDELRYGNINTISAAVNIENIQANDLNNIVKKIKSPDESTYL